MKTRKYTKLLHLLVELRNREALNLSIDEYRKLNDIIDTVVNDEQLNCESDLEARRRQA